MSVPVVVASVPADHPYVAHLEPLPGPAEPVETAAVRRLPDPHPDHPDRDDLVAAGRWWPAVMLRPDWLARADFDLLHLHFGYDDRTPAQLSRVVEVLAARGRPLVLTLHDLRNPHHVDAGILEAQLDVLVPAAAGLITLTDWAADEVERRWGRRPVVVPHPHVVDLAEMDRLRTARERPRDRFVVGVACKSLRTNTDPLAVLPTIRATLQDMPGATLRVTVHRDAWNTPSARAAELVDWLATVGDEPGVEVVVHDRLSDAELWADLAGLELAVLPYRFGTHSGWLEACHDVGTRVLAPAFGGYAAQGADLVYDADGLPDALRRAHDAWRGGVPLAGRSAAERRAQRAEVAAAHLELYRDVLVRQPMGAAG